MKNIILFLVIIAGAATVTVAQTMSIFDTDQSAFPVITSKFNLNNSAMEQVYNLSVSDFEVWENGVKRKVLSVSCPAPKSPDPISSVLVMDASGSMGGGNLSLAQNAARIWINNLPLGKAECAITCFENRNYFIQDFTSNKSLLLEKVNSLFARGGTDYDAAFISPEAGGIIAASKGKYKRVIVFLSDGFPNQDPSTQEIIDKANENNICIFSVLLGQKTPECLKEITTKTGGMWFESGNSSKDIEAVYLQILHLAQDQQPCTIAWESEKSCRGNGRNVLVKYLPDGTAASTDYTLKDENIIGLLIDPESVYIRNIVMPSCDTIVAVTAENSTIGNIVVTSDNQYFTVSPKNFSLAEGETKYLKVTYSPPDSGYNYAVFSVASDLCDTLRFYVAGGTTGYKLRNTLKLVRPNGGEVFLNGTDTEIAWEGILPDDKVRLSYSTDAGTNWKVITDDATGLKYTWKGIPNTPSNRCLMKVQRTEDSTSGELFFIDKKDYKLIHKRSVTSVSWSPDGKYAASAALDTNIVIYDAVNDEIYNKFRSGSNINYLDWGAQDEIAVSTFDAVYMANPYNFTWLYPFDTDSLFYFTHLRWNPAHDKIAVVFLFSKMNQVLILDHQTKGISGFLTSTRPITSNLCWSPDGRYIAAGDGGGKIIIWDMNTMTYIREINAGNTVVSVSWSPDGEKLAGSCLNGFMGIWNPSNGFLIDSKNFSQAKALDWDKNSNVLAIAQWNGILIYDYQTGSMSFTYEQGAANYSALRWSPADEWLCTGDSAGSVTIWKFAQKSIMMEDVSDTLWSIVNVKLTSQNIDMGQVRVNDAKDSVVAGFLNNPTPYDIKADTIFFTGNDPSQFGVVSGAPPVEVPAGGGLPVEFWFRPSSVGKKSAQIIIVSLNDTIRRTITGEGIDPSLRVSAPLIDFGKVEVLSHKDTLVFVVENKSAAPLTVNSVDMLGPDVEQFSVTNGGSFTLQGGEKKQMSLRFEPLHLGRTTGQLGFNYNGAGSPAIAQLFGTGTGGTVTVLDDSAYAGEYRRLKLKIENVNPQGLMKFADSVRAKIRFQNTIISAYMHNTDYMIEGDSVFVAVRTALGNDSILAEIPVVAGLGSVSETSMDIIEFGFYDKTGNIVEYDAEKQSGIFKLLGICPEGGNRLVNPRAGAVELSVQPQPATDEIVITFWLDEEGPTKLFIADLLGNIVKTIIDADNKTYGLCTIKASVGSLPSGVYMLVLQTPTTRQSVKLVKE